VKCSKSIEYRIELCYNEGKSKEGCAVESYKLTEYEIKIIEYIRTEYFKFHVDSYIDYDDYCDDIIQCLKEDL